MNRSKQAGMAIKTMVALLVGLNLASVHGAEAQQPVAKVPRIGFVLASGREGPAIPPFRQGLRELGYVEGKNILIEYRYAEVRGPNPNLDGAFQAATKDRVNALITITGGLFNLYTKRIADLAIKNRLPSMNERRNT